MAYQTLLKQLLSHVPAILIFLGISVIYFLPQLQGKVMPQGDITSFKAIAHEVNEFKKETGELSLWSNSSFGGMPMYQTKLDQPNNLLKYVIRMIKLYIPHPIGLFFGIALTFYFLLLYLKINRWLSIIGALAFSFAAGNLITYEAGHVSKLHVFATFPLILIGMLMVFKKKYWQGGVIFALGLGVNLYCNHVQMTYYFFLALGLYSLVELVVRWKDKDLVSFGKGIGVLILATLLGLASSSSKLLTTQEYAKDTMRGDPILESNEASSISSSQTEGLDWQYATQWSNGWMDLAAGIIPGIVGGGSGEKMSKNTALYKDLTRKGANLGNNFKGPMYWGVLPVTSGPYYYGAIFCFLFILGFILLKGSMKWGLSLIVLVFMLLSMGKNFAILNHFLFDYFPFFNKFRAPNSALWVGGFFVPIMGVLVVSEIVKGNILKDEILRGLKIALGITGGFCLVFALLGPSLFDFSNASDARLEQMGYSLEALYSDRSALMRSDALRSLVLILLSGGLIWAFVKNKLQSTMLIGLLAVLAIGDILLVDKRYIDHADFVPKSTYSSNFSPRPADAEILKDKDPNYRVLDLSINTFSSATSSYFHKTIGGYHPAKLQRYQDLIDYYLIKGDQGMLKMMNTKYVITQDQKVQRFPGLGNAWMVSELQTVNTANEEIEALAGLDAAQKAVVHQEFGDYIAGLNPTGSGNISLTEYRPNYLSYESNGSGEELAVFSEVWYGPDKGWNAYIDGELTDHIRVNYVLRALKIPAGKHKIEFKFEPSSFRIGETITLIVSLLILLGFFTFLYFSFKNAEVVNEPIPPVKPERPAPKLKATKSKKGKKNKDRKNR